MSLTFSIVIVTLLICLGQQATTQSTTKTTPKSTITKTTTVAVNLNNVMQKLIVLEAKLDAINSCTCGNSTPAPTLTPTSYPTPKQPRPQPPPPCANKTYEQYGACKQEFDFGKIDPVGKMFELPNGNLLVGYGFYDYLICNLTTNTCDISIPLKSDCGWLNRMLIGDMVMLPNGNLALT